MDLSILEQFGLRRNDIKVYNSLLKLGKSKTGLIAKQSRVVSSRVYESLNNLIDNGLVSYEVRNNIRYYQAELPDQFIEEIDKSRDKLKKISQEIKKLPIIHNPRNEINYYEGKYGYQQAELKHIEQARSGDLFSIISYSPHITNKKELISFYTHLDQKVIKKNIRVHLLFDRGLGSKLEHEKKKVKGFEVRYMPMGYSSTHTVNISKHEVLLSVWDEQPIAIAINSLLVIKNFQQNFDYLWNKAKEK